MSAQPTKRFATVPTGSPFRQSAQEYSPPWLLGYDSARLQYSQALMWDALAEYTRLGVLQRYPTVAQPDALAELGKDRRIWRGLAETDDHYAERLRSFKRTWKHAGNAPTLLRQLWEYMTPNTTRIRYVVNGYTGAAGPGTQFADWWTIDSGGLHYQRVSPCNWNWDGSYGKNVRFWLIVYRTDLVPAKWGVPPYPWSQPGLFWGGGIGSNRDWVIDTFNIVAAFKAAGSHMGPFPLFDGGLIIANPTATAAPWGPNGPFDPVMSPGYPMPNGTFQTPSNRPPGAIYVSGL